MGYQARLSHLYRWTMLTSWIHRSFALITCTIQVFSLYVLYSEFLGYMDILCSQKGKALTQRGKKSIRILY